MIPSGMKVRYFGAFCNSCDCHFQMPLLSDFSYGEFIFAGRGVHGYLNGITEPAWDDIDARLRAQGLMADSATNEQIRRMQEVIAVLADPLGGQRLASRPLCANCGSRDVAYGDAAPGSFHELPAVTFEEYKSLSDDQRNWRVANTWRKLSTLHSDVASAAGHGPALSEIFSVFRKFRFTADTDIRLGSLGHLFEGGAATRAEVDLAMKYMFDKRWLVENERPNIRPGGHRLTEGGMSVMNSWPLTTK